jgi:hypothetical protein
MSHTTTTDVDFSRLEKLREACDELGYGFREHDTVRMFDRTVIEDCTSVTIPEWRFPVAVKDGKVSMDTYNGVWGDEKLFTKLKNRYSTLLVEERARLRGQRVERVQDEQGRTRVRVMVGG